MRTIFILVCLFAVLSLPVTAQTAATPALVYATPSANPTPTGTLVRTTAIPNHNSPVAFSIPAASAGLQVTVNGLLIGATNVAGGFTITFPSAGTYRIGVEGYPDQTVTVN